jgi:hypothetical protein
MYLPAFGTDEINNKDKKNQQQNSSNYRNLKKHIIFILKPCSHILSEWLLINANSAIFQLYHGENKLIFIEMMMRSALF